MSVVSRQLSVVSGWLKVRLQRTTDNGPRTPRRGITLTEVLISMGILAIGLLGVAAIFPVGGFYMQKATIADNGSAIAQSVMNDMIARGTVNPKAWSMMIPAALSTSTAHTTFPSDGKFLSPRPSTNVLYTTFTRPFATTLNEAIAQPAAAVDPNLISRQFGNAYVIDPMYIAAAVKKVDSPTNNNHPNNAVAYGFPASAVRAFPRNGWAYYNAGAWGPWTAANTNERIWPIRRMTLQDASGWHMGTDMASHFFRGLDDLTTDLPSRADRPARQNWDMASVDNTWPPEPMTRTRTGDYSWIVSVVPTTTAARNGLASNPEGFSYDVSVVVFYKRVLPSVQAWTEPAATGIANAAVNERAVSAKILSTGLNGGELLLQAFTNASGQYVDGIQSDPFLNLKTGNWIMLCGPHPNSTLVEPRFVMKWYQVLTIETESVANPKTQRVVTVRGPQWPWLPAANPGDSDNELSNDLCAGICRGAVAVHTKTVRLEGDYGSGMAHVAP